MRIDILTVLPELLTGPLNHSIIKRSEEKGIAKIHIHNIRDYSTDKHKKVDDYPFSDDAGMVMMIEPIERAINHLASERDYDEIILTAADGELYEQKTANYFSTLTNIIILCGHYKGVDQRVIDRFITKEVSIGNYVLTGGELAAMVITDSVIRLLPGVLGNETSALTDSFQDNLLAPPVYTRPAEYKGMKVPDILRSGDKQKIDEWKLEQSIKKTKERRPDLLKDD